MLLWLGQWLTQFSSSFSVFNYLTLRAILSAITALGISLLLGPWLINKLREYQIGQAIREVGPKSHLSKAGTPTMGGLLILLAVVISTLLWGNLSNRFIWVAVFTIVAFGWIGWIDDYRKVVEKNSRGLPGRWKYFWQSVFALMIGGFLFYSMQAPSESQLVVPFFKEVMPQLGVFFLVLAYFTIVGSSNAVNLTDGLDGLAIMPTVMVGAALGVCAYIAGNVNFSNYLHVPYVAGSGELAVFCSAIAGAGIGFLWFNTYPAQVFMGDVGSLALGAALGVVAVIVRQEIILFVMGGIFVAETISVILQVAYYKRTGRRIFLMAPLHHHFELKGWPEPRVIVRFWIITLILVLIGLATLKIR